MKYFKDGVNCDGVKLEILDAILASHRCYITANENFTVTSICDGKHSATSLHYKGLAIDIRTRDLVNTKPQEMAKRIQSRLGDKYDVVCEPDHIHIEYDPV